MKASVWIKWTRMLIGRFVRAVQMGDSTCTLEIPLIMSESMLIFGIGLREMRGKTLLDNGLVTTANFQNLAWKLLWGIWEPSPTRLHLKNVPQLGFVSG